MMMVIITMPIQIRLVTIITASTTNLTIASIIKATVSSRTS